MIKDHIKTALICLKKADAELNNSPDIIDIQELIEACELIDREYRRCCYEMDEDNCEPDGTCWEQGGESIEFYIDHWQWGEASKALARLKDKLDVTT